MFSRTQNEIWLRLQKCLFATLALLSFSASMSHANSQSCIFSLEDRSKNAFLQFSAKYPALSVQFVEKIVLDSGLIFGRPGLEAFDSSMIQLGYYQSKSSQSTTYASGSSNPDKSITVLKKINTFSSSDLKQIANTMEQKIKEQLVLENDGSYKSARSRDFRKAAKRLGISTDTFHEVRNLFSDISQKPGGEGFLHEMILSSFPFHAEVLMPFQARRSPLKWGLGTLGLTLAVVKMPLIALDASVVSTLLVSANNAISSFANKRDAKELQSDIARSLSEQLGEILWLTNSTTTTKGQTPRIPVIAKNLETMDLDNLRSLNPRSEVILDLADLARFGSILYRSSNYFILSVQEIEVMLKSQLTDLIEETRDTNKVARKKPKNTLTAAREYQAQLNARMNKINSLTQDTQRLMEIAEILDEKFELYREHYKEDIDAPLLTDNESIDDAHTLFTTTLRTLDAKRDYHLTAKQHLNATIISLAQELEMISDLQSYIGTLSSVVTNEQTQKLSEKLDAYASYLERNQIEE